MATRYFEKSQMATFPESMGASGPWMSGYAAPLRLARVQDRRACHQDQNQDLQPGAVADWHALSRGLRWAFAIEGGTALLIYAIWRLWL
jgi:hypothetical protein